mmetsp:Transcript_28277/g.34488  ORF Transcript_28277/g.34488 Transcript_28277/m.34488 type:complete len:761 (-) Transcript_28277:353-2635(-)
MASPSSSSDCAVEDDNKNISSSCSSKIEQKYQLPSMDATDHDMCHFISDKKILLVSGKRRMRNTSITAVLILLGCCSSLIIVTSAYRIQHSSMFSLVPRTLCKVPSAFSSFNNLQYDYQSSQFNTVLYASATATRKSSKISAPTSVRLVSNNSSSNKKSNSEKAAVDCLPSDDEYAKFLANISEKMGDVTSAPKSRPKGRPPSVPGASSRTLETDDTIESMSVFSAAATESLATSPPPKKRGRGRPRKNPPKKSPTSLSVYGELPVASSTEVFQALQDAKEARISKTHSQSNRAATADVRPKGRRNDDYQKIDGEVATKNIRVNASGQLNVKETKRVVAARDRLAQENLQRYYHTELLTPREEYTCGMQVKLSMQCEEVYKGLAKQCIDDDKDDPSIYEWANACGYTQPSAMILDDEWKWLIPIDEDMPKKKDGAQPLEFVGLTNNREQGVGRGKGRKPKTLATSMSPFYNNVNAHFAENPKDHQPQLVNTGTHHEFVDMLKEAKVAKQTMVESNMRLVVSIARRYYNVEGIKVEDLVQEGSVGLTRATEMFDPTKGFKFSTYASWWIQQSIFRSLAYHSRTIRLPVHVHNLLYRVRRITETLSVELGKEPTVEQIAATLDMKPEKLRKMLRLTKRAFSMETPRFQGSKEENKYVSTMADTRDAATIENGPTVTQKTVDQELFREDLRIMLRMLNDDERRVIVLRYGLADGVTRTVTMTANRLKQNKAWVRSHESKALRKLRRPWYEKRLKEYQASLSNN